MRWRDRASDRLRNGEVIEETVAVGENGVVVTNQRLLAFVPEGDGANYRAVERPNVEDATLRHDGDTDYLEYTAKGALGGLAAIGIGLTVDFGSFISLEGVSTTGASEVGVGGLTSLLTSITSLMDRIDDALLVGGLLALVLGLGAFGLYLESRTHNLVIDIAGEEDLYIQAPSDAQHQDRTLRQILDRESHAGGGTQVDSEEPIPMEPADTSE